MNRKRSEYSDYETGEPDDITDPREAARVDKGQPMSPEIRRGHENQEQGYGGEAEAAKFLDGLWDERVTSQHVPGENPHNNDVETIDRDGKLHAYEVKTSDSPTASSRPRTSSDQQGRRQGDADYVADRMTRGGSAVVEGPNAVGDAPDQVGSRILYSNGRDGTFTVWEVGEDGKPLPQPEYIYNLDDVRGLGDASEDK